MKKYSNNPVRQVVIQELLDVVGHPDDTFDFANYIASLERTSQILRKMFADSAICNNQELLVSSINDAIIEDEKFAEPILPFSGSYTVYKAGDADIPEEVAIATSHYEGVEQVLVCNKTRAYITTFTHTYTKKEYYTIATDEDITGSLDQCITFLQEKLS